jgi:hypothetical protein
VGECDKCFNFSQSLLPVSCRRPDHAIRSFELACHGKRLKLNPSSSPGHEPRSYCAFDLCSCNLLAETSNCLSCLVTEPQKDFYRARTQDSFVLWLLFLWSPLRNKQLWSWRLYYILLSCLTTGTILSGQRPQNIFVQFCSSCSQRISVVKTVCSVLNYKQTEGHKHVKYVTRTEVLCVRLIDCVRMARVE